VSGKPNRNSNPVRAGASDRILRLLPSEGRRRYLHVDGRHSVALHTIVGMANIVLSEQERKRKDGGLARKRTGDKSREAALDCESVFDMRGAFPR
jgi:hypothetical protein